MSTVILYGGLRYFQIESLIHNTQKKFITSQIKEIIRVLVRRIFHVMQTGIFYTNTRLAKHLLDVHLNGKIKKVEIPDDHKGTYFECDSTHTLFDQVLKNIQSIETRQTLETKFKTKKSSRDEFDEMIQKVESGEIKPIAWEPIFSVDELENE